MNKDNQPKKTEPNSRPRASATKAGSVFSGTTGTTAARFSAPARPTSRRLGMDTAPRTVRLWSE